ncbi:DUF1566 domain-containing protein [Vibrio ostreicida]|uniref:DUF1566 domain-containing protein n=1 Tax=Vibrio ostreicida TaxID=526588 RepID=UPI003B59857F
MTMLTKMLSAGAVSILLIGCGGGNESDPKLETPSVALQSGFFLSGVVLDGYLKNAIVCLDKNSNAFCDSSDGEIVRTDELGRYTLPYEGAIENYMLLVEAVAGETLDSDDQGQALAHSFTLEVPSYRHQVISPLTSMVASLAASSGTGFDEAAQKLANDLNLSADMIVSDYVTQDSLQGRELHQLARGIARSLQLGMIQSANYGLAPSLVRKGALQRLGQLDIADVKSRTDKIPDGMSWSDTNDELNEIGYDYRHQLSITQDDIHGDQILLRPSAPKHGIVNDAADTFNWTLLSGFPDLKDYQYSLDKGKSWQAVTAKPLPVGAKPIPKGEVQIRIAANRERLLAAGMALISSQAFTETVIPAAPVSLSLDDGRDEIVWQDSVGYPDFSAYEYTLDNGKTWVDVVKKPQPIGDVFVPIGHLKLRVKANVTSGSPAGHVVKSTIAMTLKPDTPLAPALRFVDDDSDLLSWNWVPGFEQAQEYQIDVGEGWQEVTANPYHIGNVSISANTIKVRVKANSTNGRLWGQSLVVDTAFHKVLNKPAAPKASMVNDAEDRFDWKLVTNYDNLEHYEYSLDYGVSYRPVTSKPQVIGNDAFEAGQICIRVAALMGGAVGDSLCSDQAFTVRPPTPAAPSQGVVDDALNTFNWAWVSGFESANHYQYRIDQGQWRTLDAKPIQLDDREYLSGSIEVRIKRDPSNGREPSAVLANATALTKRPSAPLAPTGLKVDDIRDTLDWIHVAGFSALSDYEWSVNGGREWAPVPEKPLIVGDIAKPIGEVYLRVRANRVNGRQAGAVATNGAMYTARPKLPAPTNGHIASYRGINSNSIRWDYVSASVDGHRVDFNEPEYYEFTVDQGASWQTASKRPQFVGSQAYDKSIVGLRLKQNAISGLESPSSEVLWASNISGEFTALQYVPMNTFSTAADFVTHGGWSAVNCIAEYDVQGKGTPVFWALRLSHPKKETLLDKVNQLSVCDIDYWAVPNFDDVAQRSARTHDSLPEGVRSYLLSDANDYPIWANKSGQFVTLRHGVEVPPASYSNFVFARWAIPESQDLLADISSELVTMTTLLGEQAAELDEAMTFFNAWLLASQNGTKTPAELDSDSAQMRDQLSSTLTRLQGHQEQTSVRLAKFEFQARFVNNRADQDSVGFIEKVAQYRTQIQQLTQANQALAATVNLAQFGVAFSQANHHYQLAVLKQNSVKAANVGGEIHQASLDLHRTLAELEKALLNISSIEKTLDSSLAGLLEGFPTLGTLAQSIKLEWLSLSIKDQVESLSLVANDGLNRAHQAGYAVTSAQALIDGRFAKIDLFGRYLPVSVTEDNVWKCVEDTSTGGKRRLWMLLDNGLPNGQDDMPFDTSGADIRSVMGAAGLLEHVNQKKLCGFDDWALPHVVQLKSLATFKVDNVKNDGYTINTDVFHHHKALLPEYDLSHYQGGVRFYYWTNLASSASQQYAYQFSTIHNRASLQSYVRDAESGQREVTLARLVREDPVQWQYLTSNGDLTDRRVDAQCAKNTRSGEIWQIYQPNTADRYQYFSEVKQALGVANAQSWCGQSHWRLPSHFELTSLIPWDETAFSGTEPEYQNGYDKKLYLTDASTDERLELFDFSKGNVSESILYGGKGGHYLYRFVSK